jgi:hypothetical protein
MCSDCRRHGFLDEKHDIAREVLDIKPVMEAGLGNTVGCV